MSKLAKVLSRTVKGSQFVGVRGYENQKGEVSNYLVAVGYDHAKMKAAELSELQATSVAAMVAALPKHDENDVTDAFNELLVAKAKPVKDNPHALAQIEAYTALDNGVLINHETQNIMVRGLCLNKTVVKTAEENGKSKKAVNSSGKTLAKRAIEAHIHSVNRAAFGKITQFILEQGSFKMQKALID